MGIRIAVCFVGIGRVDHRSIELRRQTHRRPRVICLTEYETHTEETGRLRHGRHMQRHTARRKKGSDLDSHDLPSRRIARAEKRGAQTQHKTHGRQHMPRRKIAIGMHTTETTQVAMQAETQ